jgi:GT2 family glycosyltransferase
MFMRRSILEELGGYDESLAYEDFDFWVRAARIGKFAYNPKILVEKRKLNTGWSAQQYRPGSKQLETTYRVCLKAQQLNRNKREIKALGRRLGYELRQAIRHGHPALAYKFWVLKREVWPRPIDWLYRLLIKRASS